LNLSGKRLLSALKGNYLGQLALVVVIVLLTMVLFAPYISPHDPNKFNLPERNKPPVFLMDGDWKYPLGTDPHGRDVLSRIIHGARVSLGTATAGVSIAVFLGVILGICSGYLGGVWDSAIMRSVDVLLSIPLILMALIVVAILGSHLINIIIVMGAAGWIWHARIVRGNVLRIREEQYVLAAINLGTPKIKIVFLHLLPNLYGPIMVTATIQIGYMVILESGLSFFGITGSTLSWGWDIAFGRSYLGTAWWVSSFPGVAIFLSVFSFNLLGDFLRDLLDPQGRQITKA